jgi:hypothetical protein
MPPPTVEFEVEEMATAGVLKDICGATTRPVTITSEDTFTP